MDYIVTNGLAILVATGAGLIVSAVYAALLRPHRRLAGERARAVSPWLIAAAAIAEFWLASILAGALILAPPQAGAWTMALGSAIVIWIGFIVPALLVTNLFDGLPASRGVLNCAHWIAVMLVQAAILHAIGLTRPS